MGIRSPEAKSLHSKTKLAFKAALLLIIVGVSYGILTIVIKYSPIFARTVGSKDALNQNSKGCYSQKSPQPPLQGGEKIRTLSSELATNWPMFRGGPALLGIASGKLPDSLKLYWKFRTGGPIKSSATVEGGRVYIGSDDGKVYGLDLASGRKIWSFQTGDAVEASPCLLNGLVFVGSSDSFLYALDAETGNLKWKYKTDAEILGAANWALSPRGHKAWILVGSYDSKLHCVDSLTGQAVWTYETDSYINGAPAIADGKVVFGGCDAMIHVVSIANGKKFAEIETGSYIAGSLASTGRYAYVGNYGGKFLAADIAAGKILWTYEGDGAPFFSSPAVGETRVVFGSRDKHLHCIKRDSGKLLWTFETRGKVDSSPAICNDKVVVGSDDGRLYIIGLFDGKELWSYEIGEALTGSPAVASSMVIIGSEDGYVYAFGPE